MKKFLQRKRKGAAVPLAVIAVMILLAMGVGLLSLGTNNRIYASRTSSVIAARSAADAGLTMALFQMNDSLQTKPWRLNSLPKDTNVQLPYSDGVFSYGVTGDLADGYVATSTGTFGSAQKTVSADLELKGLFDHAVLTRADLILKSATNLDAYNSADASDTETDADIATQSIEDSAIVLNSGVSISGDVRVGRGGNPDTVIKDLGATVDGWKYAMPENDNLTDIEAPPTLFDMGTGISAKGTTVTFTPADNGKYTDIALKSTGDPGILEIDGGDVELHITGNIDLGNTCEIVVKDGSTLKLYVDGNITCDNGSSIWAKDTSKNAEALTLYGTGEGAQTFDLKAKNEWLGVIYAPNTDVTLYAGGDIYGAIIANNFELKAGGDYHYDRALKEVSPDDEGVKFVFTKWHEN
jgi:choice-of-anchor A domain-containing protein